jgi:hypothetical protein
MLKSFMDTPEAGFNFFAAAVALAGLHQGDSQVERDERIRRVDLQCLLQSSASFCRSSGFQVSAAKIAQHTRGNSKGIL